MGGKKWTRVMASDGIGQDSCHTQFGHDATET